ncbi:hypothetical protein NX059_001954 [Plenodomus lindquistii]|nr:hypothetical protein NX059_001954 [Plenodomus lindquistii]
MDLSERRASTLRKDRRRTDFADESGSTLINQISKPFDFQHLTHTDRHQFAALEKASVEDLASSFQAAHVSRPTSQGLNGIKTDSLHFRNFSSENIASVDHQLTSAVGSRSNSRSPEVQHEWQQPEMIPQFATAGPKLRLARSVESFSQPGVSPRKPNEPAILASPPRSFARRPPPLQRKESGNWQGEDVTTARRTSRSKRESGVWDSFVLPGVSTPEPISEIQEDSYFGHALTTPDDSAIHATTPPFSPRLADVAEEPERFISPRPAPQPPSRTPTTPKSPYFESFSFANHRSPPTRTRSDSQSQASSHAPSPRCAISRPSSQMSETLGTLGATRQSSVRYTSSSNRRISNTWRAIEESWEDDVDYIYENALEADCDSAWDRTWENHSNHENRMGPLKESSNYGLLNMESEDSSREAPSSEIFSGSFRTSLLVPSTTSLPDLAPASTISASTTSTGVPTPCDQIGIHAFGPDEGFVLTPSLLIPQEYKDTEEVTYEDLLDEYNGSDRHFPMIDASQSIISSARSSRVRFSRRSSYDSSLMSSVQSSGLWSSPVRRSASSAGSVPELVPSRRSRKDLGLSLTMDNSSDQTAALEHFGNNTVDDDITPPGRAFEGQTFFTADGETNDEDPSAVSIVSELKESLELARRGSQRTKSTVTDDVLRASLDQARQGSQRLEHSPMRQHKPTLSESAAKLLSGPVVASKELKGKARNRAATTTNAQQPMLSLFPSPPRHTARS